MKFYTLFFTYPIILTATDHYRSKNWDNILESFRVTILFLFTIKLSQKPKESELLMRFESIWEKSNHILFIFVAGVCNLAASLQLINVLLLFTILLCSTHFIIVCLSQN